MTTAQVLQAMRRGALLHMEHRDGENVWWLTNPHVQVSPRVATCVISCDEARPLGDALPIDGSESQTWIAT